MPQVDFYVLKTGSSSALEDFVCRLTQKALKQYGRIFIAIGDDAQLSRLDQRLWESPPESFLPHQIAPQPANADTEQWAFEQTPVLLGSAGQDANQSQVYINLTGDLAPGHENRQRIAEIVIQEPALLAASRERFRFYRDQGYSVQSHDISV